MTPLRKAVLIVLVSGTLLVWAAVGITAAAFYRSGTIAVQVAEQRSDVPVRIAVPALLAEVAIEIAPSAWIDEMARELDPVVPAVRAGWEELSRTPDFVLVEVRDGDDHVVVEKRERKLVFRVETDDARFRVAVPMGTVRAVLNKLDRDRARS